MSCSQLCIDILKPDCYKYHVLIMSYYSHIEILFSNWSFMIHGAIYYGNDTYSISLIIIELIQSVHPNKPWD